MHIHAHTCGANTATVTVREIACCVSAVTVDADAGAVDSERGSTAGVEIGSLPLPTVQEQSNTKTRIA